MLPVNALTHWRAPFTGGIDDLLPTGTVVLVDRDPLPSALAVSCSPEDYEGMESPIVPEEYRAAPKYNGYSLVIRLTDFGIALHLR